jgi:hypothetical protein
MSNQSLVPVHTVVLYRDGKQVIPQVGIAFSFTEKEVAEIKKSAPMALREPVNEGGAPMTPAEIIAEGKRLEKEADEARKTNEAAASDAAKNKLPASNGAGSDDL